MCGCSAMARCSSMSAASRWKRTSKSFLDLDLPGRKVLVGSGPQTDELKRLYPDALFTGPREGEALAEAYASADVFVFPSLTDTFGLVLLEALASRRAGGRLSRTGPDRRDHRQAGGRAQCRFAGRRRSGRSSSTAGAARAHALRYSWENSARQFIENVLAAHNLGLPAKRARLRPWRQKKTARLGGNRAVSFSCVSLGDALGELASSQRWLAA